MRWMAGWDYDEYVACPLSVRAEILIMMREESEEYERSRTS